MKKVAADGHGAYARMACRTGLDDQESVDAFRTLAFNGGAAGNRTRVLRHSLKASPCAVRYASARIS